MQRTFGTQSMLFLLRINLLQVHRMKSKMPALTAVNAYTCSILLLCPLYRHSCLIFQDYPSVGHVGQIIKENRMNVIFAVPSVLPKWTKAERELLRLVHETLSSLIEGSKVTTLDTSVTELVRDNYKVCGGRCPVYK